MSDNQNNQKKVQFSLVELVVLVVLQISLLSGAFYIGTKFGSSSPRISTKGPIQDQEVARLLPQAENPSPDLKKEGEEIKQEKVEGEGEKKSFTAFDKSAATVFRIKSSANSEYTLQISSYPDEIAAVQVVEEWKKKGYMAFLSVEDIPDKGKWYRVNVGNFGDEKSAEEFAKKLQEKENVEPRVVVNQ